MIHHFVFVCIQGLSQDFEMHVQNKSSKISVRPHLATQDTTSNPYTNYIYFPIVSKRVIYTSVMPFKMVCYEKTWSLRNLHRNFCCLKRWFPWNCLSKRQTALGLVPDCMSERRMSGECWCPKSSNHDYHISCAWVYLNQLHPVLKSIILCCP